LTGAGRLAVDEARMDPYGDFGQYLAGLDWTGAVAAAALAVLLGGLFLVAALAAGERAIGDLPGMPPRLAGAIGRLRRLGRRGDEPATQWLCGTCHSWNPPGSEACASGCGPRASREQHVPVIPDELGRQRGGRGTRRG
jgi:hypothetical protein